MERTRSTVPFQGLSRRFGWFMIGINVVGLLFAAVVMWSSGVVTALPLLLSWQVLWGASVVVGEDRPTLSRRLHHLGWALAVIGVVALVVQGIAWVVRQAG